MSSPLFRFFKKGFIALGIVSVFVFGFVYLQNTKKEVVAKPPIEQIWTVAAVNAQSGTAQPVDVAFGTVRSGREAQLRFGVGGEVVMVADRLRNGVDVQKGEILARLDNERFVLALEDTKVQIESENRQIE